MILLCIIEYITIQSLRTILKTLKLPEMQILRIILDKSWKMDGSRTIIPTHGMFSLHYGAKEIVLHLKPEPDLRETIQPVVVISYILQPLTCHKGLMWPC